MRNKTLSVSVMSGKGGVGKTNIALNLGYCLYKGNHPLLLVDCDMGLANLDVLLGIAPEKNLQDLVDTDIDVRNVVVELESGGFDFLPAASGVPELVEMDGDMRHSLFKKLTPLFADYDFLFMDLGAGINQAVLAFATMSRMRIVVLTPEPTSLTDSYALIKVLTTEHGVKDYHIVVNQAESKAEEKQTFQRLHAACDRFLGIDIKLLGGIRHDKTVAEAVRRQTPLMKMSPSSPAGQDIFALARTVQGIRRELLPDLADEPVLRPLPAKKPE